MHLLEALVVQSGLHLAPVRPLRGVRVGGHGRRGGEGGDVGKAAGGERRLHRERVTAPLVAVLPSLRLCFPNRRVPAEDG